MRKQPFRKLSQMFLKGLLVWGILAYAVWLVIALPVQARRANRPLPARTAAAIVVDGVVDSAYGSPIAADPAGDGNGNANMDLLNLYVAEDAANYYFAFTVNADIGAANWGKYVLYIDTTNDSNGAASDAWGRSVIVSGTHKPEYALYSWVDSPPYDVGHTQLVPWNQTTTSWDWGAVGAAAAAAIGPGATSVVEWQVAKADLGSPNQIWVEVWNTGGGGSDNAQDTINNPADDWNAADWSTQAVLANSTQYGAPVVDGVVDSVYGNPVAVDPAGDGNGNANMDLLNLYVTDDAANYYFAFTVNADIGVTNWGKYVLYIDTTNDSNGAASDAWGRNVVVSGTHKPEYALYSWVDSPPYDVGHTQLVPWNQTTTSWDWGAVGTAAAAAIGPGATSVVEWQVAKADLGNPNQIWVEVWNTGGGGGDNAQDTINNPADDWNATDWSTQAVLANSTPYQAAVVGAAPPALTVISPTPGQQLATAVLTVTGSVSPTTGVIVTVDLNSASLFTPTLDAAGAFTQPVTLQSGANTITITADNGQQTAVVRNVTYGAAQDNDIWQAYLGHDSRDGLYRSPVGPVITGTTVYVRLRAASGDLTGAKARLWNDRDNVETLLDMEKVADDGTYEWWQAAVSTGSQPTVYWYRFIAEDGAAVTYYEDDDARDGGWGQTFSSSPDNSWQLTVYDPAFQTPDWVKNAIIYQIFPDRFRDGDPTNNPQAGRFFYGEGAGTIVRSNTANWNTPVCDPRDAADCPGTYSLNFYGGDLQGVIDQLDYLQNLGVTAVYFNPLFESPSNHKYDAADYNQIAADFGDLSTFITLTQEAHNRGMYVILDGVFNHTSSDSVYFDRYSRYDASGNLTSPNGPGVNDGSGACESQNSAYRDWYYFTDVAAGLGQCVGSSGAPNGATYESWFGFDSLPKLNAQNPAVRDLIWSGSITESVALKWLQYADGWRFDVGGDIDPGVTNDPNNDYWEGFRAAVRAQYPDAYLAIEEWGNASSWLLGSEMDASMNYQFGAAMLSFWRDAPFTDNDHNSGSQAGTLTPLTPSELDGRLQNWIERYPPEAMYAMMNLLDSHDTNRALFMLDHNAATANNDALLQDPNYDWSQAITRLKGVALLQMTLPGAPTIYYGDEVGLVGPTYYNGGPWQDDPYNRQPYPWLDESGAPFYAHLQTQAGQDQLRNYYQKLTQARNAHPALRTGSFDTLLMDDGQMIYAYGRKLTDNSDAAIVILNRSGTITNPVTQTVTLDVSGYLPVGAAFTETLSGQNYAVDGSGQITVSVPGQSGAILVLTAPISAPPAAVSDLAVANEGVDAISLSWSAASGADSYNVYRSLLSGGGYQLIANTVNTIYTDTGLTTGQTTYYIVRAVASATGLVSGDSNEVSGLTHYIIGWANLQWPPTINHTLGVTPTAAIYGQVWINGVTSQPGATAGLMAQVGYGLTSTLPVSWTNWVDASFNTDAGSNDEFMAQLLPETAGSFYYVYRYSTTAGRDWTYADQNGPFTGAPPNPGVLTVAASSDTSAPTAPANLTVTDWSPSFIALGWDAAADDVGVYGYDLYRSTISGAVGTKIDRALAPTTAYTDTAVQPNQTYYYHVLALDTGFNASGYSNQAMGATEAKVVSVTFRVGAPDYTPGALFIAGDMPNYPQWNPAATPMSQVSDNPDVWEVTLTIPGGAAVQYKYTRGSWDKVESWGAITGFNNRNVTVSYGADGTQLVDDTAVDWGNGADTHKAVRYWRDPIVVDYGPAAGAVDVPLTGVVTATWSLTMTENWNQGTAVFQLTGPQGVVSGTFAYTTTTQMATLTPNAPLTANAVYTVTISSQTTNGVANGDNGAQQTPLVWTFTTFAYRLYYPLIFK